MTFLFYSILIHKSNLVFFLSYLSHGLADHWATTVDFTSFLHSSRFSAFHSMIFHSRPVHSLMMSSHRFLCLPHHLPPSTVLCRTVLASPDDCVTCPYHFSLCLFTEVRRSSYSPMAFPILAFTSSLVMWSVQDTEEFAETSHLQCLYPSFNVGCYGSCFTCTQKYGHKQGMHQSDLGADGDVLVVPDDFQFGHCSCGLGYPGEYFRLGSLIQYYSSQIFSQIFKATDGLQFLVVYGKVSADAIGVICNQLCLLCTDLHAICCGGLFKVIYQLDQVLSS